MVRAMMRKQVLVQLDDELVHALDAVAAAEGVSRSEIIRRGARATLDAYSLAAAARAHSEAYRKMPQDPSIAEALGRAAAANTPDW